LNRQNINGLIFLIVFALLNFSFSSCSKKEVQEVKAENVHDTTGDMKTNCEKKPPRMGNTNAQNTNEADTVKEVADNKAQGNKSASLHDLMVWVPGGEFIMGTNERDAYDCEKPAHPVKVDGFWMDETEVTNAEFKKFVDATGYVTVAEKKPEWDELKKQLPPDTPPPDPKDLVAASLVYVQPIGNVGTDDVSQWWKWVPGANWKNPEGPGSTIKERMNFPVVHIAFDDAVAYSRWAGKRLPTEAEWEFAARNCLKQKRFAWGDELRPGGKIMANTWQGVFPVNNKAEDGFAGIAPVKSFEANCYGLYEMIGNVWEWTSDWFDAKAYSKMNVENVTLNPKGSDKSYDPDEPYAIKHVVKGGSFLCSENYCVNYRPSARRGQAFDSGTSNIGFRCVK
jgi:formylglycine-generating enzyme